MRIPLFRIWYSTTYTVIFFILIILLAVTPGDTIYQSIRVKELQKLFVIGGAYVLTFLIVLLVYSTRIYTNRTVLAAIPKPYVPIEDGEVGTMVRKMIVKALKRSAIIAWDSRPRDLSRTVKDVAVEEERPMTAERDRKRWSHVKAATVIPVSAKSPPWGHISHSGWASPSSPDLPSLQYWKVVTELPNLIEAKAVALAPPDPAVDSPFHPRDNGPMLPDASVVALLQRPRTMGLRQYLGRLSSFGLINPPNLGPDFLSQYEYARFSTQALTETEFRDIMAVFADILNGMTHLDPSVIEEARAASFGSDTQSLSSSISSDSSGLPVDWRTPRVHPRSDSNRSSQASPYGHGSESPQTLRTAPSMHRNVSSSYYTLPRSPSERSFASGSVRRLSIQRSPSTILPNSSSSSLRSARSVVRLRSESAEGELPYQYDITNR
ncbi:sucrase/ferredoxin domain-containing protein [Aaosphaeria arxii CBS 175.79]|uniref:Defect at low temperature protein 1 n=1 Tax=Aaosphaeria arxii CBS 175.79 TaxID=1450172 RepID=A0A6A5Y6K0_9PLEO|nr:sucrase/ferredoxin domain-containing protein [Aaosphaeria arxii CBS 175.79]KAF2020647.1 sucrase/ferredoxin domain-containing protein [Aaosphaeria arxii CBS 175.79]